MSKRYQIETAEGAILAENLTEADWLKSAQHWANELDEVVYGVSYEYDHEDAGDESEQGKPVPAWPEEAPPNARKFLSIRARAWDNRLEMLNVSVDGDGAVTVFDGAAGYYTTDHSLSERDLRRIRRAAAAQYSRGKSVC